MIEKKYLNLGCGSRFHSDWVNIDFVSTSPHVIGANLLEGLPFAENKFDAVYHSHVLEHFNKEDGKRLIDECFRVLKPAGILRIALPDLENIVRQYLAELASAMNGDINAAANYDWMIIELFDQVVRNESGGDMSKYLSQDKIVNDRFVEQRIGQNYFSTIRKNYTRDDKGTHSNPVTSFVRFIKDYLRKNKHIRYYLTGRFRFSGDVHYTMYDKFSLMRLLKQSGFHTIECKTAFTSSITDWGKYGLDVNGDTVHAPMSLFMEAKK